MSASGHIATSPGTWVFSTVFLLWGRKKVNEVLFTPVKCDVRNKEKKSFTLKRLGGGTLAVVKNRQMKKRTG